MDKATIQSLLVEVHQLRMALERSTSLVPRIQLAIQRFQLQQDRVDRLSRELRDFRGQITARQANAERLGARLKQLEGEVGQIQDPNHRKEVEEAMKMMTSELEQGTVLDQQQRAQEGDLMSQIQSEQARLSDLSDQLNALDKALQQGSPAPGGNR